MPSLRISVPEAHEKFDRGEAVFLDARNDKEWSEATQKIPGAIRVPADGADPKIDELPRDRPLIAYCT